MNLNKKLVVYTMVGITSIGLTQVNIDAATLTPELPVASCGALDVSSVVVDDSNFKSTVYQFMDANGSDVDLTCLDTSAVTDMSMTFYGQDFTGDISTWDTSNVVNMESMFETSGFNGDISSWDTSNVENMSMMFMGSDFNQDISNWNTHKVVNFANMFAGSAMDTRNIDSILLNWNTIANGNNSEMLNGLTYSPIAIGKYNGMDADLGATLVEGTLELKDVNIEMGSDWNSLDNYVNATVPSGYELDPSYLSSESVVDSWTVGTTEVAIKSAFMIEPVVANVIVNEPTCTNVSNNYVATNNEELKNLVNKIVANDGNNANLGCIDTSVVTDMSSVFEGITEFNGDISAWDMSNVVNASRMFYGASSFNGMLPVMPSLENAESMFENASSFNQPIKVTGTNVSNVLNAIK